MNGMNVAQKLTSIKETDPSESINHVDPDTRRRNVFTLSDRKDQSKLPRSYSTSCRKMAMDTIIGKTVEVSLRLFDIFEKNMVFIFLCGS